MQPRVTALLLAAWLPSCDWSATEACKPGTAQLCAPPRCAPLEGLEGTYEACRVHDDGVLFTCRDGGAVFRQSLYTVGYCACDTDEVVYTTSPEEPIGASHLCALGCDPSQPTLQVATEGETPSSIDEVCLTSETCGAPEPTPPAACPDRTVEACGHEDPAYLFRCEAGVVTRQTLDVVRYCGCGEHQPSCAGDVPTGEAEPVHTCPRGCGEDGATLRSARPDTDPGRLCAPP